MKYNQISLMKLQPSYDLRKHFEFCRLKAKIYLFLKCKVGEMLLPYACIFEIVRQKYKNENINKENTYDSIHLSILLVMYGVHFGLDYLAYHIIRSRFF